MDFNPRPRDGPPESLAESAYLAIEKMIVTQSLRPGSMISENQLSEQLGCGRTPIREALQRLKFEGYVEIHPRRGVLVAPIDVLKQLELLEVRRPLERLVVRLAAERASDAERLEMHALAGEITAAAAAGNALRYLSATRTIHATEARCGPQRGTRHDHRDHPRPIAPVLVRADRGQRRIPRGFEDSCHHAERHFRR